MAREISECDKSYFYMAIAILSERRSKDPVRQVGACIVDESKGRIVGMGYNGMPINCPDYLMPWSERNDQNEKLKHLYVTHAEMNAVVNMTPQSVAGCAIYVTLHPCYQCAQVLVRSGITKVVYLSFDECYQQKEEFRLSQMFLTKLKEDEKLQYEQFTFDDAKGGRIRELAFDGPSQNGWLAGYIGYKSGEKFIMKKIERMKNRRPPPPPRELQICESRAEELKDFLKPISWEQYFMGLAITTRDMMSNNGPDKGGACIANKDKRIVGLGYHELQYQEMKGGKPKRSLVLHAPVSAIVNNNPVSVRGCTLYVTGFPCNECAKVIVQSGIKAVVYLKDPLPVATSVQNVRRSPRKRPRTISYDVEDNPISATKRMFNLAEVRCVSYKECYEKSSIILDFDESNLR